jgi:transcriptional regulator GlxA family with amidase domain
VDSAYRTIATRTRLRLEHARTLVHGSDRPPAGIAAAVGYASPLALSKACKRVFGQAPRA